MARRVEEGYGLAGETGFNITQLGKTARGGGWDPMRSGTTPHKFDVTPESDIPGGSAHHDPAGAGFNHPPHFGIEHRQVLCRESEFDRRRGSRFQPDKKWGLNWPELSPMTALTPCPVVVRFGTLRHAVEHLSGVVVVRVEIQ